jgi:predicted PurR-regulated permease PerM
MSDPRAAGGLFPIRNPRARRSPGTPLAPQVRFVRYPTGRTGLAEPWHSSVPPLAARAFVLLASLAIVLALLYWLRPVLVPLALAVLLTFVLSPLVTLVQRRAVPRVVAVAVSVGLAFALIVGLGSMVARELNELVDGLPRYEHNLRARIAELKGDDAGFLTKLQRALKRIGHEIEKPAAPPTLSPRAATQGEEAEPPPVPVRTVAEPLEVGKLWSTYGPLVEGVAGLALAFVLVIFMLVRREDLRDRVISVFGRGRLTVTTKALDEAGERISRYLLMQLTINGGFGLAFGAGLMLIGLPYALTWGFFAAVLRYIPYLGAWLAALLPIGLSVLTAESWTPPLLVAGLFIALELITSMVFEPLLYGRRVGVSETATLVMVAFWTWLWGPVGLILATPLTVCLVLVGKYVPFLGFFDTLLGDQPALAPGLVYYQRLLAGDRDEATAVARRHLEDGTLARTCDALLVPALVSARRDRENGRIEEDDEDFVLSSTREILDALVARDAERAAPSATDGPDAPPAPPRLAVVGCPARDDADETALYMLAALLRPERGDLAVASHALLTSEILALVESKQVRVVCIAALPPAGGAHARLLCRRLRARFPELKIVVGRWGLAGGSAEGRDALVEAGADAVATTLAESRDQIAAFVPLLSAPSGAGKTSEPRADAALLTETAAPAG